VEAQGLPCGHWQRVKLQVERAAGTSPPVHVRRVVEAREACRAATASACSAVLAKSMTAQRFQMRTNIGNRRAKARGESAQDGRARNGAHVFGRTRYCQRAVGTTDAAAAATSAVLKVQRFQTAQRAGVHANGAALAVACVMVRRQ
jgi:hypothetical protein